MQFRPEYSVSLT